MFAGRAGPSSKTPRDAGLMSNNPTELAKAILAAIDEAREHGVSDERSVEMLADIVKGLREALP